MALNSETDSPSNGAVNFSEIESGAGDDLEDGEIFDDDEPVEVFKGGGFEEKAPAPDTPPKETFKDKGSSGSGDRKKGPKEKEKRSNSNERRGDKRGDRSNRNNSSNKRKRGRDSEDDHRTPNKPKQRKTNEKNKPNPMFEEEVDENEMVYVMGGNSPTASKQPPDWDMFSDEEEPERERENERGGGGGRGGRRGREGFHTTGRMSRRSRLGRGGAKRNRFSRKQNNDLTICKFFMQGKCQRGNDCPFSHTALPSKKMELCKFYMNDCCTKRDKCLYMHGDFPCKFYHTSQKCYAGKRCKFYHGKISNFLRSVLMKHLDNRELQKEFDKYSEIYEKKERDRGGRDRDRFSEKRKSRSDEEESVGGGGGGGSTPMPSPQRDEFASDSRERSPTPEREREKRERRRRRAKRRSREEQEKRDYYDKNPEYYNEECHDQGMGENEYDQWGNGSDQQQYSYPNQSYPDNNDYTNDEYPDEEQEVNTLPANLPKSQRKLFMRIQQQQQHSKQSDDRPVEDDGREEEFKEENWYYSSDEDEVNNPLNTILQNVPGLQMNAPMPPNPLMNNTLPPAPLMNNALPPPPLMNNPVMNQHPMMGPQPMPLIPPLMPHLQPPMNNAMFDNIDLSAVSKILTTVRESIQKKNNDSSSSGILAIRNQEPNPSDSPKSNPTPQEERRFRDPRLRPQEGNDRNKMPSTTPAIINKPPTQPSPVLLTKADLDLRLSDPPPQSSQLTTGSDVDLRHLPFKPAPLHQAANEIDASTSSGPPMEWKMNPLKPYKPDYASIATRSNPQTCANDPRLRKYATPQVLAQSQMVVAQVLPSGQTRMMSPPLGLSPPQTNQNSRFEETVASRDPRNRSGVTNDPRRRNQPVPNSTAQNAQHLRLQSQPYPNNMFPCPFPPNQQFSPQFEQQQPQRQDNDFRVGIQLPQIPSLVMPNMSDVDLRIQQPHYYQ